MANIAAIRADIEYLDVALRELHQTPEGELRSLTEDEQTRFDEGLALRDKLAAELKRHERIVGLSKIPTFTEGGAPSVVRTDEPADILADRSATPTQLADAITRSVEARLGDTEATASVREHVTRELSGRRMKPQVEQWARDLIVRSTQTYADAFAGYLRDGGMSLTAEERTSLSVGTNANGGYLVPTHLDPTLIITNAGSSNVIRGLAHGVTLTTGNVWHGVTTAGATFSVDGEIAEVSDDSPTVGTVAIPTYKMQGFIQASIEATEDTNIAAQLAGIFVDGRDRLEETKFTTGAGTTEPKGLFTAVHAVSGDRVVSGTAATIALADLHALYLAVPVRWRSRSTFLANPLYAMAIKALGTALSASYSTNITEAPTGVLLGRPFVESDDAPSVQTTTALDDEVLFGDLSNFYIVDMPGGFSIEYIPHLFNTTTNLPDGRRGWYAHWRAGSDVVNAAAFRVLVDKTSA